MLPPNQPPLNPRAMALRLGVTEIDASIKNCYEMPRNPHLGDVLGNIFGRCEKQRYPHERAAQEAKERREAAASESGETLMLTVYKCDRSYCGGWHLTSGRARKRR